MGEDSGGFAPVTQQSISDGDPAYQVVLNNGTSSPVTVSGLSVTVMAFGGTIGDDNPSVGPALMEPGETWNFPVDITQGTEVSDNTYLNSTCAVTSVTTATGPVTPAVVPMQNGEQNTHDQDVQHAQQSLAQDVTALENDSTTLNDDKSLSGAVSSMQTDYVQEQQEWQTVQSDSCDSMGGDADTVGGDADSVGGDLDTLQGDVSYLKSGEIQAVQTGLSNVQNDLSTLQGLGAAPATNSSTVIAAGKEALASAQSAINWADGQGNTINSEAQQLATTATNYANSHCDS